MDVKKTSFVFHFEYLADIPEELRAAWAVRIINYAERGIIPSFADWRDVKTWNAIQNRIDDECIKYHTRAANLKQNKGKNLHSLEKRFSDTEENSSDTERNLEKTLGHREENRCNTSDTDELTVGHREPSPKTVSVGVYVYVFVYVSVIGYVSVPTNQPTTEHNKNNVYLPFTLDEETLQKVQASLSAVNVIPDARALNYAFKVVSSKTYGKDKKPYGEKTESEQKAIYINALLKYPADVFIDFETWQHSQEQKAEKTERRRKEAAALKNPPSICKCGCELTPKGSAYVCLNCRSIYEIVDGVWSVSE